ncbi:MAG: ABC transporter permease [Phaeodactylibacter sp.]|nr:ABC transporter permease [Phaeodactylibacter sp.]MCB9051566.1 ABC transporter permease [Lewinellaceae bacterium]
MLSNYLKIAIRNFTKNKLYTGLNLLGLTVGMAACLLLLQYVSYEWSFDRFHSKADHIYRVVNDRYQDGKRVQIGTITYPVVGPQMDEDFPEITNHTRIFPRYGLIISRDQEALRLSGAYYVDENFLDIFDFELLAGSRATALEQSHEVMVTEKVARHFFDLEDGDYSKILGETIKMDRDEQPYQITGVLADFPENSLLQPDLIASYATLIQYMGRDRVDVNYVWSDFHHYLELRPGADVAALEAKLDAFSQRHFQGEKMSGAEERFSLQPLTEAHLNSAHLEYEIGELSSGKAVWALLVIALVILFLAWVNYTNLSSVRAIERAKEVGIRRVAGARRGQLIRQFLTEAALANAISLALAVYVAHLVQPWMSARLGVSLSWAHLFSGGRTQAMLLAGLAAWIVGGLLLSGLYPSFLLSRQQTVKVLKGYYQQSAGSRRLRQGLVVFQFAASIALISATWAVFQQVRFMSRQDLGVRVDQTLRISPPELTGWDSTYIERINSFRQELLASPDIHAVTVSSRVPGEGMGRIFGMSRLGREGQGLSSNLIEVDHEYAEVYGLQPVAGRDLRATDHNADWNLIQNVLINEAAVKNLGLENAEAAIGEVLQFWDKQWTVVGVLPDFHQRSLHYAIESIIFLPIYNNYQPFSVRISGEQAERAIETIETAYSRFYPGNLLEYEFLDESFQRLYEADQRFGRMLLFFTILAILIACLGLFGLASYTAFLRTKEVGIRRVLGASVAGIIALLSTDFIRLVFWGALIAAPLAWYGSRLWLQDFAYRTNLPWWVFLAAGALAIGIALLTVSYQAARAALSNPVEALRSE